MHLGLPSGSDHPAEVIKNRKNDKACIACAMCATICPDIAIEVYRE